jgi:Lipid A 3-O-deacylase (PagL)
MASAAATTADVGLHPRAARDSKHELHRLAVGHRPADNRVRHLAPRQTALLIWLACFCLAMTWTRAAAGQDLNGEQWFTRVGFTPAFVLPNNPFLSGETPPNQQTHWTPSMTIEMGRQTNGSRDWHHLYGLPTYGFGFSVASFGDGVESGRPLDAYTFFSWPFARLSRRVQLTTDFGMGVSWNWKEYNEETDSYRTVLGSNMNARIDWGFYVRHLTTRQMSVYAGIDFTHRSNGGMRQPNGGINVIGPSVALRYDLAPERQVQIRHVPTFQPAWEFVIGGAAGRKNVVGKTNPAIRRDYGAFDVTAALQRHFYRYGKVAAGTDLTYDGATGARVGMVEGNAVQWRPGAGQRLAIGFYGGYEHVIDRFGALVQAGYDVVRGFEDPGRPQFYMRYGWRYHVNDRLWGLFAIRSIEGRRADFLEFGAGYRMRWQ